MAFGSGHFGIIISAKDRASGILRKIGLNFKGMGGEAATSQALLTGGLKKVVAGALIAGAGVIGLSASFKAAATAGTFEQGLARVGAISQATASDLDTLRGAAIDAGIATQFSPDEAIKGLQNLAAVGFNAGQSVAILRPSLDLAAGGMIGVDQATATVSTALKAFGLDAGEAALAADKLLKISNLTSLQAVDLEIALANVSGGAAAAGQSLDQMLISIGLVKNTGADASIAASSVNRALLAMAKNQEKFAALGVELTDSRGKFRDFADIVIDTDAALSNFGDEAERTKKVTQLFGLFGLRAFGAVSTQIKKGMQTSTGEILKGRQAIEFLNDSIAGAAGTAAEFREKILEGFAGQVTQLGGSFSALTLVIGEPFAKVLTPVVTIAFNTLSLLAKGIAAVPLPIKIAAAAFFVMASAALTVAGAILIVKGIALLAMIPALAKLTAAVITTASAMWASFFPVLIIIAAVAAAIGLLFAIFGKGPPKALSPEKLVGDSARSLEGSPLTPDNRGQVAPRTPAFAAGGTRRLDEGFRAVPEPVEARGVSDLGRRSRFRVGEGEIPRAAEIRARERSAAARGLELEQETTEKRPIEITTSVQIDKRELGRSLERHFVDERKARRRGGR